MDQDSSDEEDVFSCGRCKENFSSMESFMEHKKSQSCRKARHRPMESQQQKQSPPSGMPISLSGRVAEDSIQETIQESTSSMDAQESGLNPVLAASDPEYSPQSSVARLQDVLTMLQGGQQVVQLDISSGGSEPQDGQSLMHVFERILTSSQNANLPAASAGTVNQSSVDGDTADNLPAQEMPRSDLSDIPSTSRESEDITSETVLTVPAEGESLGEEDSIQAGAGLGQKAIPGERNNGSGSVACSMEERPRQKQRSGRQRLPRGTESKDGSTERQEVQAESSFLSKIPAEHVDTTEVVMCKFCTETMTNGDDLFSHYMEVHKMKSGAALEFLRQSAFKKRRGRGRPPKRLAGKRCKPICCPHCGVSFNSKTLCAAHIRKHHRDKGTSSASKATDFPSGRRRKCSRCGFQTTTAKGLTAHIHSSHSNKAQKVAKVSETISIKTTQSESKPKTQRGRKQLRRPKEDVVTIEQDVFSDDINSCDVDDNHQEEAEDDEEHEMEDGQETNNASGKAQVKCPECNKKMCQQGLKRHQVRCVNKNRYICPLCQHKSRESYDHTVHVDNHKLWVKTQASWLDDKSTGSKPEATVTTEAAASCIDITPPLVPMDSNSIQSDADKVDYATTVDLDTLDLITQIQGESNLLQQNQLLLASGSSRHAEQDLQKSEMSGVSLLPEGADTDTGETHVSPSVEQEPKCIDGGDKKLNPRDLKCKICYTWFSRTSLPKHMLQVHSLVKRFQCRETSCKLIFAKLEDFKTHVASHSTENMFRCGCRGCVKRRLITPETMDNLRKEKMRDYYKHMSHKCSKCWVKFPSQGSLDRHMKRESHIHPCNVCGKIQVSKRQLRMHMVTHQAERAYLCEVCGQNFKTKRDLNKHTFSHNNIRPYQCPNCAKCFSFRNKMNRHMVTVHSATKPYTCDWPGCDKAFSRKDKLADHYKTHLVSYPFKCQYCTKGFYRKDNLKDHEILHTREFPFRCVDCNRGFMRPKILERHRLTDHAAVTTQITLQASITQDAQSDSPAQSISYVLCEPYVYANIDQLTSFQDNVQEADVQLMQGQRATIEAIQNAAAAVIGNGQAQFQIDHGF
ncbi:zinc finger protein 91-like [Patiria miniata]|uniref:C2H2-type domain-containing protein n=1 Tax=Patiria miniata TaxID=46514 RepID=A0A914AWW6_PATMI|nr:zinc finger protein 91-like [Patiria miniata]XP_038068014.1 zinc finger protein 91-like [Patiria miniata]